MFGSNDTLIESVAPLLALLVIGLAIVKYLIYLQEKKVARWLIIAERDFNNLVAGGTSHGSRLERVAERREWNQMAEIPFVQINTDGYRSVAHDLADLNEKELAGKGSTMGKASNTAFLLRFLYEGDVEAAQAKIFADSRNGSPPYLAPGVYQIVGFEKFDPENGFPPDAGVPNWLMERVVQNWNFPRQILMTHVDAATGETRFREPIDALRQLVQQNI